MNSAGHLHLKKSEIAKNINPVFLAVFFRKFGKKIAKTLLKPEMLSNCYGFSTIIL